MTLAEAVKLIKNLFPAGSSDLYDWDTLGAWPTCFLDARARLAKEVLFDHLDALKRDLNPSTAESTLSDWEESLGLANTPTAKFGTLAQRREAILGFMRMAGTFALDDIRAIVQPYFKYINPSVIQIVECNRAGLETANAVSGGGSGGPVANFNVLVRVFDGPLVSPAGAILNLNLTTTRLDLLSVGLVNPDGFVVVRGRPFFSAVAEGATGTSFRVHFPEFAGRPIDGDWEIGLESFGSTVEVHSSSLFVEGLGVTFSGGSPPLPLAEGKGGAVFQFLVAADEALLGAGYDLREAQRSITRWKPAHTLGGVAWIPLLGSICAIPDTMGAIPDLAVPC